MGHDIDIDRLSGEPLKATATPSKRPGENPHSHNVSGYRTMTDGEVEAINAIKEDERRIANLLLQLEPFGPDPRCMAIARTKFEEAFMFAVKAIAKPADPYRGG